MPHLTILQLGKKLPSLAEIEGDFSDWFLEGMGLSPDGVQVIKPQTGDALPDGSGVDALIITGSAAMVTDSDPWIKASSIWVKALVERDVPTLGICFGHQLLAHAMGGLVEDNPKGVEVGTVTTHLTGACAHDPLFSGMETSIFVQVSHQQIVSRLPDGAVSLAWSEMDQNHAFRLGDHAWGIQFHPEFDALITAGYVDYYASDLEHQGVDIAAKRSALKDTEVGHRILQRFSTYCQ